MSGMAPVDPHDAIGWSIVWLGVAATAFSFVVACATSLRPGEREPDHPKRSILREDR